MAVKESEVLEPLALSQKHTILCVDDDPAVLRALRRLLRDEPYDLVTTESTELAMEWIRQGGISLVLLDQRMPGMCGTDFAEQVRRLSPDTIRVMLTGFPGSELVQHGMAESIDWLVSKPWNDQALRLNLRQLLREHEVDGKRVKRGEEEGGPKGEIPADPVQGSGNSDPSEGVPGYAQVLCHLTAEHLAASALAESFTLPEAAPRLLQALGENLGWEFVALWTVDPAAKALRLAHLWQSVSFQQPELEKCSRDRSLSPREDLPGRVWSSGKAAWISNLLEAPNLPRLSTAARGGLHSACGVPILSGGRTMGVLELMGRTPREPDLVMLDTLQDISRQLAQFLEREGARDERDRFFALAPDMMSVAGTDGYLKRVNPAWQRTLGWSPDDLLSRPYIDFVHPQDRERTLAEAGKCGEGGETVDFENRFRAKDGSYRWLAWTCPTPRADAGRLYFVARDVTEQKKTIENLHHSEERHRALLDSSWDILSTVSKEGIITSLNPAFETLTGWSRKEWLGQTFDLLVHTEDRASVQTILGGLLEGAASPAFESRLRTKSGTYLVVESVARPQFRSGADITTLIVSRDITRRRKIEEERDHLKAQWLQGQKLQTIGQLSAGIAHEINNPVGYILSNLSTILGYIQDLSEVLKILREMKDGGADLDRLRERLIRASAAMNAEFILEDFRKAAQESRRGAERVRDIVRSLREFSHVDQDELRKTDLNQCLEDALRITSNEFKHKVTVHKDYGPLPQIDGNPLRLSQVFLNLLVNAAQAIREKGEIYLKTAIERDEAVVRIRDTGVGIPEENLSKIFGAFFTTKPAGRGAGLGLHLARMVIQAHGGRIEVRSRVGAGTEFSVRLPLSPAKGGSPP